MKKTIQKTTKPIRVRKGQVWTDCNPRTAGNRLFEVMQINRIKRAAVVRNCVTNKESIIALNRFKPGSRGYSLVRDVQKIAA